MFLNFFLFNKNFIKIYFKISAEGPDTYAEWSVEGRRKVRLVPRVVPQTAFLAVARRVADVAQADNAKMPWPAATARPPPIPKVQTTSAQVNNLSLNKS